MNTLSVLGSINQDWMLTVHHFPLPGETVLAAEQQVVPGGKGANQAIAAARFGAKVHMIGCVGDDEAGARLLEHLTAGGVDTALVTRVAGTPSGAAFITLAADKQNSIIVTPGANSACGAANIDAATEVISGSDIVVASLEIPISTVERAAAIATASRRTRFVLNPSPPQRLPITLLERTDVVVVNEHEARALAGLQESTDDADAAVAAKWLVEAGSRCVIVTCGAAGALCAVNEQGRIIVERIAAPRVEPIDTTGAGDAFMGALAASLTDTTAKGVVTALRFAVAAGSLATTVFGAQGYISLAQVNWLAATMGT